MLTASLIGIDHSNQFNLFGMHAYVFSIGIHPVTGSDRYNCYLLHVFKF